MVKPYKYFELQIREAFKCFFNGVLIMAALFVVAIGLIYTAFTMSQNTDNKLITVGIVCEDGDYVMDALVKMVKEEQSISSFCNLEKMEYDTAMSGFKDRSVDIVMVVPEDFYEKASTFVPTSIQIYAPSDMTRSEKKLLAIIDGIEEVMLTTEGAMYSMYDGMKLYSFPVSTSQMEMQIFEDIITQFMNRSELFEYKTVSMYGDYSLVEYYIVSAIMLIILICSITFFDMYSAGDKQLERMVANSLSKKISITLIKIISITLPVGLLLSILGFIANILCENGRNSYFVFSKGFFLSIWIFAFSMAVFVHLIISILGNNQHTKTIYLMVILLMLVMSGVIVPTVYLPKQILGISDYLPTAMWQKIMMNGFWNSARRNMALKFMTSILITDVIFVITSMVLYIRRLNLHD